MVYEVSELKKVLKECEKKGCDIKVNHRHEPRKKSITKKMKPDRFLHLMEENYGSCNQPENPYFMVKTRNFTSGCFLKDFENNFDLLGV